MDYTVSEDLASTGGRGRLRDRDRGLRQAPVRRLHLHQTRRL